MSIFKSPNYIPVPRTGPTVDRRSFEQPSYGVLRAFGVAPSAAGVPVTETSMLSLSAVFGCVRALAEDEAKLPMKVYRKVGEDKTPASDHPVHRLLHDEPNPEMTAFDFRQAITACAALFGRSYAEIERTRGGQPLYLWPIEPWRVQPKRTTTGTLYYEVDGNRSLAIGDVLNIKGLSLDGVVGEMIARHGQDSMGLAMAAQKFAASFYANGAAPGIVITHPEQLSPTAKDNIAAGWNTRHRGPGKAHGTAVLDEGMKVDKVGFNAQEAQGVESRQWSVEDVARWFRVPPSKIGHLLRAAGWSTLEAANTDYVIDTLMPWFVRWEQECKRKLFLPRERDLYVEHVADAMLRGDAQARAQFYLSMLGTGAITPNIIAAKENLPTLGDDGNRRFITANLRPIDAPAALPARQPENKPPADPAADPKQQQQE